MLNEYERKIVELWEKGFSAFLIAQELKVTKNSICGKVFRMREKGVALSVRSNQSGRGGQAPISKARVERQAVNREAPLLDLMFKKKLEPQPKPVVVVKEPPLANPLKIKFWSLKANSCRYVINDGRAEDFIFCGSPKERGPYCEAHAAICFVPPKSPEKKPHNPNAQQRYYR